MAKSDEPKIGFTNLAKDLLEISLAAPHSSGATTCNMSFAVIFHVLMDVNPLLLNSRL